jgi:hypothetical protein
MTEKNEVQEVRPEVLEAQEKAYQEALAKHKEANGKTFSKAKVEKPVAKKAKVAVKETKAPVEKKPAAKGKKERRIVGVKDLEAEFGLPGKTIRRHLRKMEENKKPRGPEPYQWFEDDKDFAKIRANLQNVVARQPKLQAK